MIISTERRRRWRRPPLNTNTSIVILVIALVFVPEGQLEAFAGAVQALTGLLVVLRVLNKRDCIRGPIHAPGAGLTPA